MSDRIKSDLRREVVAANVMAPSKSALTKSAILNAAMQFLEAHQFRDLTVGILMANTGYSRATFYQYFNDLHGLMETLLDGVRRGDRRRRATLADRGGRTGFQSATQPYISG